MDNEINQEIEELVSKILEDVEQIWIKNTKRKMYIEYDNDFIHINLFDR